MRAAIDFWKKKASDEISGSGPGSDGGGRKGCADRFCVRRGQASGWVGKLLKQLDRSASFAELDAPASFSGTLRQYQVRGYSWLSFLRRWGLGACLADDMGLGKTIQTLALIQRDWESNGRRPVLLICPTTVVNNWVKEAARFTRSFRSSSITARTGRKEQHSRRSPKERPLWSPVTGFCTGISNSSGKCPGRASFLTKHKTSRTRRPNRPVPLDPERGLSRRLDGDSG